MRTNKITLVTQVVHCQRSKGKVIQNLFILNKLYIYKQIKLLK
jgi:hypothetical protein